MKKSPVEWRWTDLPQVQINNDCIFKLENQPGDGVIVNLWSLLAEKACFKALGETCHSSDIRSDLIMTLMYAYIEREAIQEKKTHFLPQIWGEGCPN